MYSFIPDYKHEYTFSVESNAEQAIIGIYTQLLSE